MSSNNAHKASPVDSPSTSDQSVLRVDDVAKDLLGLDKTQAARLPSLYNYGWKRKAAVEELFSKSKALDYHKWCLPINEWEAEGKLEENVQWLRDIDDGLRTDEAKTKRSTVKVREIHIETQDGEVQTFAPTSGTRRFDDNFILAAMTFFSQKMSSKEEPGSTVWVHCHLNRDGLVLKDYQVAESDQSCYGPCGSALHGTLDQLVSVQYGAANPPCNVDRELHIASSSEPVFSGEEHAGIDDDGFLLLPPEEEGEIVDRDDPMMDDKIEELVKKFYAAYPTSTKAGSNNPKLTLTVTGSGQKKEEMTNTLHEAICNYWP